MNVSSLMADWEQLTKFKTFEFMADEQPQWIANVDATFANTSANFSGDVAAMWEEQRRLLEDHIWEPIAHFIAAISAGDLAGLPKPQDWENAAEGCISSMAPRTVKKYLALYDRVDWGEVRRALGMEMNPDPTPNVGEMDLEDVLQFCHMWGEGLREVDDQGYGLVISVL